MVDRQLLIFLQHQVSLAAKATPAGRGHHPMRERLKDFLVEHSLDRFTDSAHFLAEALLAIGFTVDADPDFVQPTVNAIQGVLQMHLKRLPARNEIVAIYHDLKAEVDKHPVDRTAVAEIYRRFWG